MQITYRIECNLQVTLTEEQADNLLLKARGLPGFMEHVAGRRFGA
jgi:hypothetical protein